MAATKTIKIRVMTKVFLIVFLILLTKLILDERSIVSQSIFAVGRELFGVI